MVKPSSNSPSILTHVFRSGGNFITENCFDMTKIRKNYSVDCDGDIMRNTFHNGHLNLNYDDYGKMVM